MFEELILDFDVSHSGRKKHNFLMQKLQNIPSSWLEGQNFDCLDVSDRIVDNIVSIQKVPKFTYSTLLEKSLPDKRMCFWQESFRRRT